MGEGGRGAAVGLIELGVRTADSIQPAGLRPETTSTTTSEEEDTETLTPRH